MKMRNKEILESIENLREKLRDFGVEKMEQKGCL